MNVLSILSALSAYSFVLTSIYIVRLGRMDTLKATAMLVNLCFAFWSFCYVFFYAAPDEGAAWFWHRVSAVGWICFCAFALHFFLILSGATRAWRSRWPLVAVYAAPAVLLADALSGTATPVALGVVRTASGATWTYVPNASSPWYWAYAAYIVGFFAVGLGLARRWARKSENPRHRRQGDTIVWLDIVVIALSACSDLVAPWLGLGWPPVATLLVDAWMVGFLYIIRKYKLMDIHEAASAELILATIIDPVLLLDKDGVVSACNNGCAELFKAPVDAIRGQPLSRFLASGGYDQAAVDELFARKRIEHRELDLVDARGKRISAVGSFSLAETKLDGPIGIVANLHDVGALKRAHKVLARKEAEARRLADELYRVAHYDTLTGLPNRRLFFQRLGEAIAQASPSGKPLLVAFADLDGFKAVNDSLGHEAGDRLLAEVSRRLCAVLDSDDTAARVGGDEFVVILRGPRAGADDETVLRALGRPFDEPIDIGGQPCRIGLSVGIARFPGDGADADSVLRAADERMYDDKRRKRTFSAASRHFHTPAAPDDEG